MAAYAVAWFWGGRTERFAAAVMLMHFAVQVMSIYGLEVAGIYLLRQIGDYVRVLIFGWLCFRSNRWWPFLMAAACGLLGLVDVVAALDPDISHNGAVSAKIGLGYLGSLTLMLSVVERILAGELPAAREAWARANAATATRRNRKNGRVMGPPASPPRLTSPLSRPTSDR